LVSLIFSTAVFLVFTGTFLICYIRSKHVYDDMIEGLDKKEYGLQELIPLGLYYNETIQFRSFLPKGLEQYRARSRNMVKGKVIELYGIKYSDYYWMIHNGNKAAAALLLSAGFSFFGFIMTMQGDRDNGVMFALFALAGFPMMQVLADRTLDDKIQKRRMAIRLEFPEFVDKLTLLVNAGMTVSRAWEKIINESRSESILYREMRMALAEIQAGIPEAAAYEEFGRRCKVKEIIKFVSVVVINIKKGGAEIVPTLKMQGAECWEMRKSAAKQMGEEASTKILFPLIIMFVGIILIVATPAVLSFTMGM